MFTPISCPFKLHCTYAALDSWACQPAACPTGHRRTTVANTAHQGADPGPASVAFNQQSFLKESTGGGPSEEVKEVEHLQIFIQFNVKTKMVKTIRDALILKFCFFSPINGIYNISMKMPLYHVVLHFTFTAFEVGYG